MVVLPFRIRLLEALEPKYQFRQFEIILTSTILLDGSLIDIVAYTQFLTNLRYDLICSYEPCIADNTSYVRIELSTMPLALLVRYDDMLRLSYANWDTAKATLIHMANVCYRYMV